MNELRALVSPKSIVIVGASDDPSKLGGRSLHYLMRDGYAGRIYAVNPKYKEVAGVPCYPDVESLPESPEAALIAVSAEKAIEAVEALGKKGVLAATVLAGGFREMGPSGADLERRLVDTAHRHGMRICGPNNNGVINAFDRTPLTISQYAEQPPMPGPVAFVSQSGAFGTAVALQARELGIGLGYFVNTGNEADVTATEVMGEVLDDTRVTVGMMYLEGLRDGERLIEVAEKALALGKPLVVAKVGRFAAGQRAAVSHTGALAVEDAVLDGIMRQHGMIRAFNETHALDLVHALSVCPVPPQGGVAVITMSGGAGALMSDRAGELGIEVPELDARTQAQLRAVLPSFAAVTNPVDLTAQGAVDPKAFGPALSLVLDDPKVAVCVVWLQHMHRVAQQVIQLLTNAKNASAKPLLVCWSHAPHDALIQLREAGVCVIESTHRSVDAAAGLIEYGEARRRFLARPGKPNLVAAQPPIAKRAATRVEVVPSMEARELLLESGLQLVASRHARTADEARRLAEELGLPVAVKIESPDLAHKSDVGGVVLGVSTSAEVVRATELVLAAARSSSPQARIEGVLIQKMAPGGTELVLGLRRDPTFGPIIMLGLGGIFIEVLKDVVFASASITERDAEFMISRLRGRSVLDGLRGRQPVNLPSLAQALCALSRFATAHPYVVELDINPVFAGPDGIIAVDWLMVRKVA